LSCKFFTTLGLFTAWMSGASGAAAEPQDAEARSLAKQAMQGDYLGTDFKAAEQKLQKALKSCGKKACSAAVRAELHLDLAVVYIAGSKKKDKGKKELQAAIAADPNVELSPDFTTPEVEKAFVAAGGVKHEAEHPAPEPEDDEQEAKPAAPVELEETPETGESKNWLSAAFQLDFLAFSQTDGVCSGAAQYQCFLQGQSYTGPIYDGSGNQVQGGLGVATKRVLLGYERLLGENVTLGARVGFAFGGSPKATSGNGTAFLPLHAELRGSYWFGAAPFQSGGLRGFAGLAAGLAEVDGHVTVEYFESQQGYQQGQKGKLDAWRKTGNGFASLNLGLAYGIGTQQQLLVELRVLQMLGAGATGGALSFGYGFGL
jgi:hypothetical protein